MKHSRFSSVLLMMLLMTGTLCATSYSVDFKLEKAEPKPLVGSLEYNPAFKSSYASASTGYKFGSTNNSIAWILPASETITAASFSGYINSNNTTYTFGYAFSTDRGQTWGTQKTINSDGTKKESTYTIPAADIPSGANAVKIIRTAGTSTYLCSITVETGGGSTPPAPKSSDATLKEIKYDGTLVPGFNANTITYNVVLPANYSGIPSVSATANDSKATVSCTQIASLPGTALISVTAEDQTTKKDYSVNFTKAAADEPVLTTFTVNGVVASINQTTKTVTATLPAGINLTSLTPTLAGEMDSYSPTGAQNFTNPVQYTVTKGSSTVTYTVTLTVASAPVTPPSITSFMAAGVTATINEAQHTITAQLPAGTSLTSLSPIVAIANADSYSPTGAQNFTNPVQYTVTKGSSTVTYTVTLTVAASPVTPPATSLKLHEQEIYEGDERAGGYGTPLVQYSGREYEVYYVARLKNAAGSKYWTMTTTNQGYFSIADAENTQNTETSTSARDGWFKGTCAGMSGNESVASGSGRVSAAEEFSEMPAEAKLLNDATFEMYVKGYDQFRLYARDNNATESKGKHLEVYIDGVKQQMTLANTATIRSFSMTQDEHLIRIVGLGGSNNYFYGFSLRLSNQPRTKYIAGNDSSQVVIQESAIEPVRYAIRNYVASRLEWVGTEGTGFSLSPVNAAGDTLELTGTALCPVGDYTYKVVALDANNLPVSSCTGHLTVKTAVYADNGTEHTVWINDPMEPIRFSYGAVNDDVTFQWTTAPDGVTATQDKANNTWTISGTPTKQGSYSYTLNAAGGNTITGTLTVDVPAPMFIVPSDSITKVKATNVLVPVLWTVKFAKSVSATGLPTGITGTYANGVFTISGTPVAETSYPKTYTYTLTADPLYQGKAQTTAQGQIIVIDPKAKALLYLYSDTYNDGIYTYLNGQNYDLTARPADAEARTEDSYSSYNLVILSENVDANNAEALSIARGNCSVPVLNMKVFLYTTSRLGWGFPDNGSIANTDITVLQPSHPVFRGMQLKEGQTLNLLSDVAGKRGLMPSDISLQGTIALATAPKRGDDYYSDGDAAIFLHEIPASMRKAKYMLFPIGGESSSMLTPTGKQLLKNVITYLMEESSSFTLPELRITSFRINGETATIDESKQEITLMLPEGTDLTALQPEVSVLGTGTWVTPGDGETVDFSDQHYGVTYTVTDGINRKAYKVIVRVSTALDNLTEEGLWFDGVTLHNDNSVWVNIYDAAGRKLTQTNTSYSFSVLPSGLYLVQTSSGTMRILN